MSKIPLFKSRLYVILLVKNANPILDFTATSSSKPAKTPIYNTQNENHSYPKYSLSKALEETPERRRNP